MKEKIIAKRYAEAFAGYARDSLGLDTAVYELKELRRIIRNDPGFKSFLENPEIVFSEKYGFLDRVLAGKFSPEVIDLLKLLIAKRRVVLFPDIVDYIRVNYSRSEKLDALLKSAYPLDLDVIRSIKEKIENKFHRKMNLFLELDGSLLGGVQVVVGNTVIDGTARKRIDDLREKLKLLKGRFS